MIIDAGDRISCGKNSIKFLNDSGVVMWDNTDGKDWPEIKEIFTKQSFKEISFTGMIPQEFMLSRTTIFYRKNNCLKI